AHLQQLEDVPTRHLAPVTHRNDLSNLPECQPDRLCAADERQAVQHGGAVVPVPRGGPRWRVDYPHGFVEAQRLVAHPRTADDFTDSHAAGEDTGLTLQCTRGFSVVAWK